MVGLVAAIALVLANAPQRIAITHVSIVDVAKGLVRKDMTVLLSGDTIEAVTRKPPPANARRVDGLGRFLIPGLWDMHVHCCNADDHFFPLFVANGVTGIRDMADPLDELKLCRSNVQAGVVLGPRIVFSGLIVDGPKPCYPDVSIAVGTPEQARSAVERLQSSGVDFIKVYSFLPRTAYFALAAEANKRHMVFAGHVPSEVTAREASDAGQKSFEHLLNVVEGCSSKETELLADIGAPLRPTHIRTLSGSYESAKARALFKRFRKNGTWQCPTLTVINSLLQRPAPDLQNDPRLRYLAQDIVSLWKPKKIPGTNSFDADEQEAGRVGFELCCKVVGEMSHAGVGILAGTDTPNAGAFPGFGIHDELAFLVKAGLSPAQALRTATLNPARFFGWEKKIGTVQAGKVADLVLLEANPLEDIHNTTRIAAVFLRGRYLARQALEQMLKEKPSI